MKKIRENRNMEHCVKRHKSAELDGVFLYF